MKTDHPKPYQFYLVFLLAGVLLVFCINSCRKENIPSNNPVVTKVLNGHGIDITRLRQAYQQGTSSPLKVNDISSQAMANIVGTLNVDWSSYTLQEFPDSSKIIEFPMPDDTTLIAPRDSLQNGHNKYTSKTCAVFVLHKDTIVLNFFMKTVESLNAPGYQSVINQLHYLSIPGGFNGEVLYFTLGRQFINGYVWQNGSIKQSMTIGSAPASPPSPASQNYKGKLKVDVAQVSNCVEDEYEVVLITTVIANGVTTITVEPIGNIFTVTTCEVTDYSMYSGGVNGGEGTTPAGSPCGTGSGASVSSVINGRLSVNSTASGSGSSSSPCDGTTGKPGIFGYNNSNAVVSDANFDALLSYVEGAGLTFGDPFNTVVTVNGAQYSGQVTQIYDSHGNVVAGYFSPDESSGPFQVGNEYSIGDGSSGDNGNSSSVTSSSNSGGNVTIGFGGANAYLGNSPSNTVGYPSPGINSQAPLGKGFMPLCKSSIVLMPLTSNTSQVNMTEVFFGIMDLAQFPLYKTQINVIEFNLYISIPNQIKDPTNNSKKVSLSAAMLQEFIYQAYGYASEQINLIHGQDFFSVGAQPKYSALFATYMMYYLNYIALHGMFLSYEIANSGLVPSLGAKVSNNITSGLANPAYYTMGSSGEGC